MANKPGNDIEYLAADYNRPLDRAYWNAQWENRRTGWDMGTPSPPITTYMDQYRNKNAAILIPGCGNAYEAEYLAKLGFSSITLLDIAPRAVEILKEKFHKTPEVKVVCGDFFEHEGTYDLIIEQTFFCAIHPSRRREYAKKAAELLIEDGRIIGVLFDKDFERMGPPFGGHPDEYKPIFDRYFDIKTMTECYNSIPPRAGAEVFINLTKKKN
ncbi:MAG: methyltransferase domain-containing protein [Chitinophagaceae bacterium]|nr:methyltransferase domain-containing protein [Chitinophagaceae bacterium]